MNSGAFLNNIFGARDEQASGIAQPDPGPRERIQNLVEVHLEQLQNQVGQNQGSIEKLQRLQDRIRQTQEKLEQLQPKIQENLEQLQGQIHNSIEQLQEHLRQTQEDIKQINDLRQPAVSIADDILKAGQNVKGKEDLDCVICQESTLG